MPRGVEASGRAAEAQALTAWAVLATVVPVTLGNVLGGGVPVAAVSWFVYLRPAQRAGEA